MSTWTETSAGSDLMLLAEDADSDICPGEWRRSFDRADITTRVIFQANAPSGDPEPNPVQLDSIASQTLYGIEPFERLDLWNDSQAIVQENAGRILATRNPAISMPRVRSVTLDAVTGNNALDFLTLVDIYDDPSLVRGRLVNDRGLVFDLRFFAVGVTHDLSADGWTAEIALDRSSPYERLDPVDYVWDTARWDRSLWN